MRATSKNKKNIKISDFQSHQKPPVVELILIFLISLIFGYLAFSLISQIYSLNLELKDLVATVQSLQENQINLKSQLSTKDQEIKILETTIQSMNKSSLSASNDTQNLELLKKELLKNNNDLTTKSFLKTSGIILGAYCIFRLISRVFF